VGEPKTRTLVMWPREPRLAETNAGIRTLTAGVAFSWTNVAPDEYYFALFEDVDVVTLQSYGYLAQFNELASRLTLTAGAAVEAEAKVIPRSAVEAAIP
jgi:hypothetical protein